MSADSARGGPSAGQVPAGVVKKFGLWVVVAALILAGLVWLAVVSINIRSGKPATDPLVTGAKQPDSHSPGTATLKVTAPGPAAEAWNPPSPEPTYDHFMVFAGKGPNGKDIVTKIACLGFTVTASPGPDLAYDIYLNGQFFAHVPKKSERPKDWSLDKDKPFPNLIESVGYHLTPGQGYEKVPFGCVMTFGDEDLTKKDKLWYARAMTVDESG